MQLTESQIIELKDIISKKGVKYTDVQMEILDHVASAVEDRMSADPNLTFEDAFTKTNASFGIFGLSELENSIINGMNKKYSKIFWKQFLSFFSLKYIGLVLFLAFLIYQAQLLINDQNKVMMGLILLTITLLGFLIIFNLKSRKTKNFLVHRVSMAYFSRISSFYIILNGIMSQIAQTSLYGVNLNLALMTIMLVFLLIYLISSTKTAIHGSRESKKLAAKYGQLNY